MKYILKNIINLIYDRQKLSDGYHTFKELYDHRVILYICLMNQNKDISWKSFKHNDGEIWDGWFIAGMKLPTGNITYHLPNEVWDILNVCILPKAPKWDGHNSSDVLKRLEKWTKNEV